VVALGLRWVRLEVREERECLGRYVSSILLELDCRMVCRIVLCCFVAGLSRRGLGSGVE
jgi:hypothetical protein